MFPRMHPRAALYHAVALTKEAGVPWTYLLIQFRPHMLNQQQYADLIRFKEDLVAEGWLLCEGDVLRARSLPQQLALL